MGPRVLAHMDGRFCYSEEHLSSGIRGKGGTTQRWVIPCCPGDENPSEAGMLQPAAGGTSPWRDTPLGTSPWGQLCSVPTATRDLPSPSPPPCQLGATPARTAPSAGSPPPQDAHPSGYTQPAKGSAEQSSGPRQRHLYYYYYIYFFLTCKGKSQPRARAGGRSPAGSTLSESRAEQATRRFVAQELDQTQITAQALHRDRRQRLLKQDVT